MVYAVVNAESDAKTIAKLLMERIQANPKMFHDPRTVYERALEVLEILIADGWIVATINKKRPFLTSNTPPITTPKSPLS